LVKASPFDAVGHAARHPRGDLQRLHVALQRSDRFDAGHVVAWSCTATSKAQRWVKSAELLLRRAPFGASELAQPCRSMHGHAGPSAHLEQLLLEGASGQAQRPEVVPQRMLFAASTTSRSASIHGASHST